MDGGFHNGPVETPENRLDSNEMTGFESLGSRFNFFHEFLVCFFFFFFGKMALTFKIRSFGSHNFFFFKASDFFKIIPFSKWLVTPIYILSHRITTYPSHGMIDEFIPL